MAIVFFQVTALSRGAGRSAPAAAAYRAGERLRDERTGQVYNHARRRDVEHREILLPRAAATTTPDWVRDRSQLWNAAEAAEPRRNSRVATEFLVGLPHELGAPARTQLALRFAQTLADRYGIAVDVATHLPRSAGDARNFHAHLLATTRELTPSGLGPKSAFEYGDWRRRELNLPDNRSELRALRAVWSGQANEALLAAGHEATLDPRTLRAQGIDRQPVRRLPMAVVQMERRGIATDLVRELRASGVALPATVRERERLAVAQPAPPARLSIDELQAQARERWRALRHAAPDAAAAASASQERNHGLAASPTRGLEWGD